MNTRLLFACISGLIALTGCSESSITPTIDNPFKDQPFVCTQGNNQQAGSHQSSFLNTRYALDFTTPAELPAAKIYAGLQGRISYIKTGCDVNESSCGSGFGNYIVLDSSNGFLVLYAHLAAITVVKGQKVNAGDLLGLEGKTGWAGHRHLHFSVHKTSLIKFWQGLRGTVPASVPFIIRIEDELIRSENMECTHNQY